MSGGAPDAVIRVLLVEDHALVRAGIERLLSVATGIDVVGEASNGLEAIAAAAKLHPDVVVMDLSMPGLDGIAATRAIVAANPQTRVLVLTSFSDQARIVEVFDAGAVGYLLKDADPEELTKAVRAASRGEMPLDPRAARLLLGGRANAPPKADLTDREQEVLELVATGHSNKTIARRLGISEKTVKAHLTKIFQRIGVTDRTQAALWASKRGLGSGH